MKMTVGTVILLLIAPSALGQALPPAAAPSQAAAPFRSPSRRQAQVAPVPSTAVEPSKFSATAPGLDTGADAPYHFHHNGSYARTPAAAMGPMPDLAAAPGPVAAAPVAATPVQAPAAAPMKAAAPVSANAVNNAAPAGSNNSTNDGTLLFIQQAKQAYFIPEGKKMIMSMTDVSAQTIFFADRPERYAGSLGTDHFSSDRSFYSNTTNDWLDAPNAALFGHRSNKPQNNSVIIVTLHDPVYNATTNTLNYTVTFVPGRHNGSIAEFYRRHKSMPTFTKVLEKVEGKGHLKDVALFIDNFQSTNLLSPNPVDNTFIPGGGGGCFYGGWGWGNGCGGAWW